jgi:hypothetical protein
MPRIERHLARIGAGAKRKIFAALGLVHLAIGVVGVIVPGIPGTLFLLAASYFFARSSPRLARWLREHPRLGPYLRLAERGSMPRGAKVGATLIGLGLVGTGVILFRIRTSPAA